MKGAVSESRFTGSAMRRGLRLALLVLAGCSGDEAATLGDAAGGDAPDTAYEREFGPGPVSLVLRLDRTAIALSDRIQLDEELRMDPGFEADFPEYLPEDFEGFAVVDSLPLDPPSPPPPGEGGAAVEASPASAGAASGADGSESGARVRRQRLVLEPSRSGELKIAPLEVFYRRTDEETESFFRTEEIAVQVEPISVVGELEVKDPRDIFAAPPSPPDRRWIYWTGGALGAAAALAALLYLLLFRRGGVKIAPARPPHEIAWQSLRQLVSLGLVEKGQIERFYVYLSGILRVYIENRFRVRAPERTTEEFLLEAGRSGELSVHRARLEEFLDLSDQVKFARFEPEPATIQSSFDVVKMFIQETTPHES